MIDTNSERFREVNDYLTATISANLIRRGHLDDAERKALPDQVAEVTLELLTKWEASRMHPPTEADQDGHPCWVCWTEEGRVCHDKAIYEPELKRWWAETVNQWITPDKVMRLPMGDAP